MPSKGSSMVLSKQLILPTMWSGFDLAAMQKTRSSDFVSNLLNSLDSVKSHAARLMDLG